MEIYVFDSGLNWQGIVEIYTSLQWQRWFLKSGEFELVCPLNENNLNLLQKVISYGPRATPKPVIFITASLAWTTPGRKRLT